jgi:hypothetical protein
MGTAKGVNENAFDIGYVGRDNHSCPRRRCRAKPDR